MTPLGLYLHVPFCTRRCDYCDFYVVVGRDSEHGRFVARMAEEIASVAERLDLSERAADTIYLGGGTPSLLGPDEIRRLIEACRSAFDLRPGAEVTLEANPEGIDARRLAGWLEAGVNRLSIGVQILSDEGLRRRGRLHTAAGALAAIEGARRAGFANVSADLIAGLPDEIDPTSQPAARTSDPPRRAGSASARDPAGGTRAGGTAGTAGTTRGSFPPAAPSGFPERFVAGVREVLERRPDHLSVYLFETDKDTPLMRAVMDGRERLPDDDDVAEAYRLTLLAAGESGYERYEIASFCLPGRRSRHNVKYWTGEPYLGFGPSAHSFFRGRRFASPRDLDAWLRGEETPRSSAGGRPVMPAADPAAAGSFMLPAGASDYTLEDAERAAREALVLNLRLAEGVDLDRFDDRWGTNARAWVERDLADAVEAGLVTIDGSVLALTAPKGVLLANEVFSRLSR